MTPVTQHVTATEPRPWRHNPEIIDLGHPDVFVNGVRHDAFAVLRRDHPGVLERGARGLGPRLLEPHPPRGHGRGVARPADVLVGAGHQHHLPPVDGPQGGERADRRHDHHGPAARTTPTARWRCRSSPRPRSIVSKARIREVAREVVTAAAERGECDFMKDVAAPLPIAVLCEILGVPDEDQRQDLRMVQPAGRRHRSRSRRLAGERDSDLPAALRLRPEPDRRPPAEPARRPDDRDRQRAAWRTASRSARTCSTASSC